MIAHTDFDSTNYRYSPNEYRSITKPFTVKKALAIWHLQKNLLKEFSTAKYVNVKHHLACLLANVFIYVWCPVMFDRL